MASTATAAARLAPPAGALYEPAGESLAYAAFLRDCPDFRATRRLDELRATEYRRLDDTGEVYLDYTGAGLYAESQLRAHLGLLRGRVLGNPHSDSPASRESTDLVERARHAVLRHLNASPAEYAVVFTANASAALRLVGESYPFGAAGRLLLTSDNHNSVNGIREFARAAGATTSYLPLETPSLRVDEQLLESAFRGAAGAHVVGDRPGDSPQANGDSPGDSPQARLFAYPAQSNFSGVQHPLEWIPRARAAGWDVLLDAAAFVPTNSLDLREWHPDFVAVSLYKLLGYPTGVGCLVARRAALARLRRPWFAGGTIATVSVQGDWHTMADGEAGFEDGTVNYLALPAVEQGLAFVEGIGMNTIHTRVRCLTGWLLDELAALRHPNGRPAVQLYGPRATNRRGGTISFNLVRPDGGLVDIRIVEQAAAAQRISLRTGCFCNPGASELAFGIPRTALRRPVGSEGSYEYLRAVGFEAGGAVRISVGPVTTFGDVYRFMGFAASFAA